MGVTSASEPARTILDLARRRGILRARDLGPLGVARRHLARMTREGTLRRSGRGMYALAGADVSENHLLAEACRRVPGGVICLLSALRFHGLTTQNPWQVWLAISPAARKPKVDHPPLRVARFSGPAPAEGVERRLIDGVEVKVYSAAKTVADCFKYRNKIGTDIAIEALRDAWGRRLVTADAVWHFAQVCRVANVMRRYLESLSVLAQP